VLLGLANLATFLFTELSNSAYSSNGWELPMRYSWGNYYVQSVKALAGNDVIRGTNSADDAIWVNGTIDLGNGDDQLVGKASGHGNYGINLNAGRRIFGGFGSDRITGVATGDGGVGINVDGSILTGQGVDYIDASSVDASSVIIDEFGKVDMGTENDFINARSLKGSGIRNYGQISTGDGNDSIRSVANSSQWFTSYGLYNHEGASISTGRGNDIIDILTTGNNITPLKNIGRIDTGDGSDLLKVVGGPIINQGTILTGLGNDTIQVDGNIYYDIINHGIINTGAGDDVISALSVGFANSSGSFLLGDGNDIVKGFGNGWFYGGLDIDKIILPEGEYVLTTVDTSKGPRKSISLPYDYPDFRFMFLSSFETISGTSGNVFNLANGTLNIGANGEAIVNYSSATSSKIGAYQLNLTLTGASAINGTGNIYNNTIVGNSSANILDGKAGVDRLTGNLGADTFAFSNKPLTFTTAAVDHITDFKAGQGDMIRISKDTFGITASTATLQIITSSTELGGALASSNLFVYDSSNGNLHWNQNGTSIGAGTGGVFAILDNKSPLIASNIQLV